MELAIRMTDEGERHEVLALGPHAEFFFQFSDQGFLRLFSGFDLTARKLPEPGQLTPLGAPCQQYRAIRTEQHTGYDDDSRTLRACRHAALSALNFSLQFASNFTKIKNDNPR